MDCFETQSLIMKYVTDELSGAKLEDFLEHIDRCEDCKEELAICYTLVTGIKQLDEDTELTTNFQDAFYNKLAKSKKMLYKKSKGHLRKIIILNAIIWSSAVALKTETSEYQDKGKPIYTNVDESDFSVDVFETEDSDMDELVEEYNEDIDEYIENLEEEEQKNEQDSTN